MRLGGTRPDRKGYFIDTTIFSEVQDNMTIAREEIFGPCLSVSKFKTIEEVVQRANDNYYGLAGGIFSNNLENTLEIAHNLKCGAVFVN